MPSTKWSIACAQLRKPICRRFWPAARGSDAVSMAIPAAFAGLLRVGRHPTLARSRCSADFHRVWATSDAPMAKFKQIELHDTYDDAPRPVAAMAKSFADGAHTAVHRHGRGQLLHAMRGIMR